mmetsp:Transcript_2786/g.7803  ORF Transcript_2786/g.7803 Transcript_2786/m.7803 type:complete len:134 (+) Transcript_2786:2167-2568(+)
MHFFDHGNVTDHNNTTRWKSQNGLIIISTAGEFGSASSTCSPLSGKIKFLQNQLREYVLLSKTKCLSDLLEPCVLYSKDDKKVQTLFEVSKWIMRLLLFRKFQTWIMYSMTSKMIRCPMSVVFTQRFIGNLEN